MSVYVQKVADMPIVAAIAKLARYRTRCGLEERLGRHDDVLDSAPLCFKNVFRAIEAENECLVSTNEIYRLLCSFRG